MDCNNIDGSAGVAEGARVFFRVSDLKVADRLVLRLREGGDPLSKYLWERCSERTRRILEQYRETGRPSKSVERALVEALNGALVDDGLYQHERFAWVRWPSEVRRLVEDCTDQGNLVRLNRLVLEEAYSDELRRWNRRPSFWRKAVYGRLWPGRRLVRWVAWHVGCRVLDGFFAGMRYQPVAEWGNPGNKLLGTYERELYPYLAALDSRSPTIVLDIGASEGYYAVGFAFRWRRCQVHAWEMDDRARYLVRENARLNAVEGRVHVHGRCGEKELYARIVTLEPQLVLVDIEGDEIDLCSSRCLGASQGSTWIVETHAQWILEALCDRLSKTHDVRVVKNEPRTPADVPSGLAKRCFLLPYDRWRLVDEGRPFLTPWIVAMPKGKAL